MKRIKSLAIANTLAFLIQLAFSWLVQFRLINTKDVGQVSHEYPTLFTPAGITFAIWGLIYLLLGAFCVYHLIMAWRKPPNHPCNWELRDIGWLFILNNLATAAWLYVWTNEWIALSLALIALQLITLIAIHFRLHIYDNAQRPGSRLFTQFPLSIYFGWITVATIANADVYLTVSGWDRMGLSAENWTLLLIGIAVLIGVLVVLLRRNPSFGLVFIWALAGIVIKRTESGINNAYPHIVLAAEIGMILLGIVCLLQMARNRRAVLFEKRHPAFPLAPHSLK